MSRQIKSYFELYISFTYGGVAAKYRSYLQYYTDIAFGTLIIGSGRLVKGLPVLQ